MAIKECWHLIQSDVASCNAEKTGKKISLLITCTFRIGTYLINKKNAFAYIALFLIRVVYFFFKLFTGIQLPLGTSVGGGIRFPHYSCIVIAKSCKIGKRCTIHQGVTIGQTHFGKHTGYPVIGNKVVIYAGAKICGNVRIGNQCVIGANAVITNDVPDNCVVVGHNKIVSTDCYNMLGEKGRAIFW